MQCYDEFANRKLLDDLQNIMSQNEMVFKIYKEKNKNGNYDCNLEKYMKSSTSQ